MTFILTGYDPATARLTSQWATDDSGTLKLNGTTVATQTGYAASPTSIRWISWSIRGAESDGAARGDQLSPAEGPNYVTTYTYKLHNQLTGGHQPAEHLHLRRGDECLGAAGIGGLHRQWS